jgi:hypothetical protein
VIGYSSWNRKQQKTAWSIFVIYTSNDAACYKEVPFGGFIDSLSPVGKKFAPKPQNWDQE